jgi:hypothetical protein
MMQILWPGAMAVQAIHVAAKLALADLVASGAKSIKELAEATHTHGSSLAGSCGAHEPRDLRRGHDAPVSTNPVERHAPERSSGIDPTLGHDAGRAYCLETLRRLGKGGNGNGT